jgi:hypothetical protein
MYTVYVFEKQPTSIVTIEMAKREADTIDVDSVDEALLQLQAHRQKNNPEFACADIGDHRTLICNLGIPLSSGDDVKRLVEQLNNDERVVKVPDMMIRVTEQPGVTQIVCDAMMFDSVCRDEDVADMVSQLISEYSDLIEAGELTE